MRYGDALKSCVVWLLRAIRLQLLITFFSLPILMAWKIPVSMLSIAGNIIFLPFLTIVLFLASMVFFTEIVHIPNSFLIDMFSRFVELYLWCLNSVKTVKLLYITHNWLIVGVVIVCVFLLMQKKYMWSSWYVVLPYFFLYGFILWCGHKKMVVPDSVFLQEKDLGLWVFCNSKNQCILVDIGLLAKRPSAKSFIEYTVVPRLQAEYGIYTIDTLVICSYSTWSLYAYEYLFSTMPVTHCYMPRWVGFAPHALYKAYKKMCSVAEQNNCIMHTVHPFKDRVIKMHIDDQWRIDFAKGRKIPKGTDAYLVPLIFIKKSMQLEAV